LLPVLSLDIPLLSSDSVSVEAGRWGGP